MVSIPLFFVIAADFSRCGAASARPRWRGRHVDWAILALGIGAAPAAVAAL